MPRGHVDAKLDGVVEEHAGVAGVDRSPGCMNRRKPISLPYSVIFSVWRNPAAPIAAAPTMATEDGVAARRRDRWLPRRRR